MTIEERAAKAIELVFAHVGRDIDTAFTEDGFPALCYQFGTRSLRATETDLLEALVVRVLERFPVPTGRTLRWRERPTVVVTKLERYAYCRFAVIPERA